MLHSEPSFSVYNVTGDIGEEEEAQSKNDGGEEEVLMRPVAVGDNVTEATCNGDFSFGKKKMGPIEEEEGSGGEQGGGEDFNSGIENLNLEPENEPVSPPLFLASGLGIDSFDIAKGGGFGGGGFPSNLPNFNESGDLEDYYKKMAKGELDEAENYYHRASMADPEDGEILLQYAKLEWQLHHVKERALSNFERAVQAAPHNSEVLAAYASFLWEIEDSDKDEDEDVMHLQLNQIQVQDSNASEDIKPLINASACNDENVEEYAKLVWEHGRDHDRASSYFEQAVEAAPEDSNVLAAYARFLWETEEDSTSQDQFQESICHNEASVNAATT